jgi:hypothetical protein
MGVAATRRFLPLKEQKENIIMQPMTGQDPSPR